MIFGDEIALAPGGRQLFQHARLLRLGGVDLETIVAEANSVHALTDHFKRGGLGSSVAELLGQRLPTPMRIVALGGYARSGPYYELRDAVGLGYEAVAAAVKDVLGV